MELRSLRTTVDARNEIRVLSIVFWIETDEAPSPTLLPDIGFRTRGGQRGLSGRQPEITKGDGGLISDGGMLVDASNHIDAVIRRSYPQSDIEAPWHCEPSHVSNHVRIGKGNKGPLFFC